MQPIFTIICAVHRALLSMDDLVDEPGIAVGVLCTVRRFRALTGVLASHLTLLLTYGHVLILDSTVLVGGWTDRFGGTLAV